MCLFSNFIKFISLVNIRIMRLITLLFIVSITISLTFLFIKNYEKLINVKYEFPLWVIIIISLSILFMLLSRSFYLYVLYKKIYSIVFSEIVSSQVSCSFVEIQNCSLKDIKELFQESEIKKTFDSCFEAEDSCANYEIKIDHNKLVEVDARLNNDAYQRFFNKIFLVIQRMKEIQDALASDELFFEIKIKFMDSNPFYGTYFKRIKIDMLNDFRCTFSVNCPEKDVCWVEMGKDYFLIRGKSIERLKDLTKMLVFYS